MKNIIALLNLPFLFDLKFGAYRSKYIFDLSKVILCLLLCLGLNFQTLANESICSFDSIPGFQEMYSYENIELIEYDFLRTEFKGFDVDEDTVKWGKKQFTILSKLVTPDSVIVDFDLKTLSFIDNSIVDTSGTFRIYNTSVNGTDSIPELSTVSNSLGEAHINYHGNFSEWFELDQYRMDYLIADDSRFGLLLKRGSGAFVWGAGLLEGLGYDHYFLTGDQGGYVGEELVGFVQAADTTGIITDFDIISSSEELIDLDFSLSPNPVSDYLRLSINSGKWTIEITDATGRLHCQSDFQELIKVSEFESGIYFIRVIDKISGRSALQRLYKM